MEKFTEETIKIIRGIPAGKVMSYGQIAGAAGNPRGARQVARILHSSSKKHNLPWHRVVNSKGEISLQGEGFETQRFLLESEGIHLDESGRLNLKVYRYEGLI